MGAKAKARRRSEEEGKVRMVPFRGFAPSLYVATAEVQGAIAAEPRRSWDSAAEPP